MATDNPFKSRGGFGRLAHATRNSVAGLRTAWRFESAFRQELAACVVLVPTACLLPVSRLEALALVASLALVLITELMNSALEAVVDRVGLERNELSKRAKDLGSASVFVAVALALGTWATVLWPLAARWIG